ncbi:MAG: DUF2829 domain-containing protein [Nitrosomonas sp.]|nr:DUF2829 domain-containing protein [Nitrosomonas sp.]
MNFGDALELLQNGNKVAREGWNGKGMWLMYVPPSEVEIRQGTPYSHAGLTGIVKINGHIDMKTATGEMQPGWLASQTDMAANDWVLVN